MIEKALSYMCMLAFFVRIRKRSRPLYCIRCCPERGADIEYPKDSERPSDAHHSPAGGCESCDGREST